MLDFRKDIFLVKVILLGFLFLVFGFWRIDLNSEEVFIAFSFLFLLVVGIVMFRFLTMRAFVDLFNNKYQRAVSSLNYIIAYLELNDFVLLQLEISYFFLRRFALKFQWYVQRYQDVMCRYCLGRVGKFLISNYRFFFSWTFFVFRHVKIYRLDLLRREGVKFYKLGAY